MSEQRNFIVLEQMIERQGPEEGHKLSLSRLFETNVGFQNHAVGICVFLQNSRRVATFESEYDISLCILFERGVDVEFEGSRHLNQGIKNSHCHHPSLMSVSWLLRALLDNAWQGLGPGHKNPRTHLMMGPDSSSEINTPRGKPVPVQLHSAGWPERVVSYSWEMRIVSKGYL